MLTRLLSPRGYETLLLRGQEGLDEGSMDYLAEQVGVRPVPLPLLRREPGVDDFRVLGSLVRVLARFRPDVLHTHAAKAGTVGRLAALMAPVGRPKVTVHTFHGHSLEGYFSRISANFFLSIERFLAQ